MYCTNCGKDGHLAGKCVVPQKAVVPHKQESVVPQDMEEFTFPKTAGCVIEAEYKSLVADATKWRNQQKRKAADMKKRRQHAIATITG